MSTHVVSSRPTTGLPDGLGSDIDDDDPDEEASLRGCSQLQDALADSYRQDLPKPATSTMAKLIRRVRSFKPFFSFSTGDRQWKSSYTAISTRDEPSTGTTHSAGLINATFTTIRTIACYSYTNTLLVFVPVGIATYLAHVKTPVVFTCNAVAIIPLSGLLTYATENIARDSGDTVGALVNITFGNLVEVIMFIVALRADQIRVVQASLLGSILVNLLLILGTAILAGAAFQDREQLHNRNEAQALACLLCVSVFSMMIPNAFYHSFSDKKSGEVAVLTFSRACALILIVVYGLYLTFQLRSSALEQAQANQSDHNPAVRLTGARRSAGSRSPHLLPRSIRFDDIELQRPTDDAMSTSHKSFELDELDEASEEEGDADAADQQLVKDHDSNPDSRLQPRPCGRGDSQRQERTTIYQRHGRYRSSNSLHSHRDRSLSAARSASSYSRIFLGSQSTENLSIASEAEDYLPRISKTASAILLVTSSLLVAVCAEFLINTVDDMVKESALSEAFIGLIILPIVGNCAEHITAVTVAVKNKLDLAIGVSVGSAIQVGLVLTPLIVLVGWVLNKEMTMSFSLFETVTLVATAFLVNFLILSGRTNFLEGSLLCACYVIIGVGAYLFPNPESENKM